MAVKHAVLAQCFAFILCLLPSLSACSGEDAPSPAEAPSPVVKAPEDDRETGDESFRMRVADAFRISGRGVVLTGIIDRGSVRVGDSICLRAASIGSLTLTVKGIENRSRSADKATAGDAVGILVDGIGKNDVTRGGIDTLTAHCD